MAEKGKGAYKDWLNSEDEKFKPKLIDSLNKAGVPLELKTKKRLENLGFEANPYYYDDYYELGAGFPQLDQYGTTVTNGGKIKRRELDLLAILRRGGIIPIKGVDLHIRLKLAVECKYSSNKDFFVFEFQDPLTSLPNFPVKLNGFVILPEWLDKYFEMPIKIEKVAEADVSKPESRKGGNFTSRITRTASEQLFSAISDIRHNWQVGIHRIYFDIVKQMDIKKKFEKLDREGKIKRVEEPGRSYIPKDYLDDFCKKNITHFDFEKIGSYTIDLIFPVIVIDETRGVIKAVLNDANEVIDFEDIGYGVYMYVSDKIDRGWLGEIELDKELPVIICNLSYLDECVSKLIEGMEKLKIDIENQLNESPHLFVKELMFKR